MKPTLLSKFNLGLLASRTVGKWISVLWATQCVVVCCGSPGKLNTVTLTVLRITGQVYCSVPSYWNLMFFSW